MSPYSHILPLKKKFRDIEQTIVKFYEEIGHLSNLNSKSTTIFAYFQVYGSLTQDELRILTKFSKSTISTTLQAFLSTDIVNREIIPGSRGYRYHVKSEKVSFVYSVFTDILADLEKFDSVLVSLTGELRERLPKYPDQVKFLTFRFNSFRNYIEAQRRAIIGQSGHLFLNEYIPSLDPTRQDEVPIIHFSAEIEKIEAKFIDTLIRESIITENHPIKNQIYGYFYCRGSLNQQTLEKLTHFSLSTISRILTAGIREKYLSAQPKSYQKSRIYYLTSPSLSIIDHILKIDDFIFGNERKFVDLLEFLQKSKKNSDGGDITEFLAEAIRSILLKFQQFREGNLRLKRARADLAQHIANSV